MAKKRGRPYGSVRDGWAVADLQEQLSRLILVHRSARMQRPRKRDLARLQGTSNSQLDRFMQANRITYRQMYKAAEQQSYKLDPLDVMTLMGIQSLNNYWC